MTREERLAWIAAATPEQILRLWRHEALGSPWFDDKVVSDAFAAKYNEMRAALSPEELVKLSKKVGWE